MRTRLVPLVGVLTLSFVALLGLQPGAQMAETGSIVGTVTSNGVTDLPPLELNKNQEYCGEQLPSEAVVANPKGHLRYTVVYVEGAEYAGEARPEPLVIKNEKCAFVPHVQGGMVKSKLEVTNEDPILHNTHLFLVMGSRQKSLLNLALPGEGARLDATRATRRPGVVRMKCDAHKWMSGYVVLFDHPFYAVTDADGSFEINDVPAGTYTLKSWHETFGELEEQVVVEPGKSTSLSFTFEASIAEPETE